MPTAAILTIGNELTSGDVAEHERNLARANGSSDSASRSRSLASVPDEIDAVARFLRREAPEVDFVLVTGGLGGTPDDLTREAVAAAFGVGQEVVPELADALRARFARDPEYAARWAALPVGSEPIENPLGGAPGFVIENVYVLPGLPAEMEAMFASIETRFAGATADRLVAAHVRDARERDRRRPRRGGRALPRPARRLVSDVRRGRAARRGRAQVERRAATRRGRRVRLVGA